MIWVLDSMYGAWHVVEDDGTRCCGIGYSPSHRAQTLPPGSGTCSFCAQWLFVQASLRRALAGGSDK